MQALSNNDTTGVVKCYPLPGALLPYNRIIAFYGIYITRMGILGEIQELK
jgi:hypothetical protein